MSALNSIFILLMITVVSFALIPTESLAEDQTISAQDAGETEHQAAPASAEEGLPESEPLSVMDQPMDGSSFEAFTAGLEKVDREASETNYRSLMSALDYLLFYDLSAKRKKELLYAGLDGKTPTEIKAIVSDKRRRN
jgi:hypothetical protein